MHMLDGQSDPREIVQEIWIWQCEQGYMYDPESDLENETHLLLWDYVIQTDHLMSVRRPDLVIGTKKEITLLVMDFDVPADHWVKLIESEKRDNYLDLARELKKSTKYESDRDTNYNCFVRNNPQKLD